MALLEEQDNPKISKFLNYEEHPALMSLFATGCLFRLGGEQTFTLDGLEDIVSSFRMRLVIDNDKKLFTITLHSREPQ